MMSKIAILLTSLILLSSCDDPSGNTGKKSPVQGEKIFVNLHRGSAKKPTYFSFAKGDTVSVRDPKNDNTWDIAFGVTNTYYSAIFTNGGVSGNANCAAISYNDTLYSKITRVPSDEFKTDKYTDGKDFSGKPVRYVEPAIPTGSGKSWYTYDRTPGDNHRVIVPNPRHALIFRTVSGGHAKVKILDYYKWDNNNKPIGFNDDEHSQYISFIYIYQADPKSKYLSGKK